MSGCLRVKEGDVPGAYKAKTDWGSSSLNLCKDHTFQQTVQLNSGEVKHLNGQWKLVSPVKNSLNYDISFSPYLNVAHDKQGVYAPWSFFSITPTVFHGLEIAADPDWSIAYRK